METWNTRSEGKQRRMNQITKQGKAPLGERYVAVDKDTLQLYYATRRGCAPKEMPVNIDEWRPSEEIKDSYYVLVGNLVYLRF